MSFLKASLLGGVDGVITSFAIVAGSTFATDSRKTVIVIGFSSLLADGFSMGVSEYLSSDSERAVTRRRGDPVLLGGTCFLSFFLWGIVPILAFLATESILSCIFFSLSELMLLGTMKAYIVDEPALIGLLKTSLLGSVAGAVAYGVAYLATDVQ